MTDAAASPRSNPAWDWSSIRDRLLADERFQRWAAAFPPTRWIARRRARQLFDLCAGFVYSQVLAACVQLDLFTVLAEGPQSLTAVARRIGLPEPAAFRLLEAACALGLVEHRRRGHYGLGVLGAALRGNPGIAAMVAHHRLLYADLADPVALLRGAAPSQRIAKYWPYTGEIDAASLQAEAVQPYTALMAKSQAMVAREILAAYPMGRHQHLLDVGGGDASFLCAAGARFPELRLTLFDLPGVADQARGRIAALGWSERARVVAGDFRTDRLPRDADLITLVRILHDHDDSVARHLLRKIREALPPKGTLLIAEPMAETPGAAPIGHAYFGFYLLAMGRGRPRSAAELTRMLHEAGFRSVVPRPTNLPLITSVLTAQA